MVLSICENSYANFLLSPWGFFMSFSFHRMMSDYTVETINDGITEFNVEFHGPKESNATKILVWLCLWLILWHCCLSLNHLKMWFLTLSSYITFPLLATEVGFQLESCTCWFSRRAAHYILYDIAIGNAIFLDNCVAQTGADLEVRFFIK